MTKVEIACVVLMLKPVFGETAGKAVREEIYKMLGVDRDLKVRIFHTTFSNNNNKSMRDLFFKDPLIQKIWPLLKAEMVYEDCFQR